jgi:hypothetical protein
MQTEARPRLRLYYCGGQTAAGLACRQPVGELDLPVGGHVRIRCLRCKVLNIFEAHDRSGEVVVFHEALVTRRG